MTQPLICQFSDSVTIEVNYIPPNQISRGMVDMAITHFNLGGLTVEALRNHVLFPFVFTLRERLSILQLEVKLRTQWTFYIRNKTMTHCVLILTLLDPL